MPDHKDLGLGKRHAAHNWEYADATARAAATGFGAGDVGGLALQLSDHTFWVLTATTPTWVAVGDGVGYAPGGTDVAVADGGTGASTAAAARTNLGAAAATHTHTASDVTDFAETARDTLAAALVAGTNVTITPNDGSDTITIAATGGGGAALTVREVDGSPTDSAVTEIVFPNGTLGIASHVATYTPTGGGGLTVQEVDGTPSVAASTLILPNGTLTDNGGGSVTYTPASGGGAASTSGLDSARPAAGTAGRFYLPTDVPVQYRDTGSAWEAWHRHAKLPNPPTSGWSWQNQGSAALTTYSDGIGYLACPADGAWSLHQRLRTLTLPKTVTLWGIPNTGPGGTFHVAGLVMRESATGKLADLSWNDDGGVWAFAWTNQTTANVAGLSNTTYGKGPFPLALRLTIPASGNIGYSVSMDGLTFVGLGQIALTTAFTSAPDQIGIVVGTSSGRAGGLWMLGYSET